MPPSSLSRSPESARWPSPIDVNAYDRSIELASAERAALNLRCHRPRPGVFWRRTPVLTRLTQPLLDVIAQVGTDQVTGTGMVPLVLREVQRRDRTYWGWSLDEWRITLCRDYRSFQRYHRSASEYPPQLLGAAYLLHCASDPHQFGKFNQFLFAKRVFGAEVVENSMERVRQALRRWGYGTNRLRITLPVALAEIMIVTRSPLLEDMRQETLEQLHRGDLAEYIRDTMVMVSRALVSFGLLPAPLPPLMKIHERCGLHYAVADVPPEWLSWVQRWQATSTLRPNTRQSAFYALCKTGRWLAKTHPDILSPADWTRELATEHVALVDRMKVGEWAHVEALCPTKIGQPLRAPVKAGHLGILRRFFQDCQEWGWMPRRFDPRRSFATPRPIRALLGPCPRIIADDCWAKLLWADLNLTAEDLPKGPYGSVLGKDKATRERHSWYPPEMEQALALLWLFSGLRSDEIRRLRVGCVRWQREAVTVAGTGDLLPPQAVCWLEVPAHKTGGAFTKPIDRAAGEAIQAWERVRPEQPLTLDFRTGEAYHCLFSFRGQTMGKAHLNKVLIPLLCQKAGVPLRDTYGKITSHRARSTITSQLYSAREPMSIWDLKEWLGHRRLASTEYYVKPTPTKLAKSYTDAEYFQRNLRRIDVLIDQEAVHSGAAASGQPWKFYDLGHGYCSYDFFEQCPHRMACAKCSFYVPKESSRAQLLEAKANLQRMKQEIPLQEEERAAVEDGLTAVEMLYARLIDIPTPRGTDPTPTQTGE